jgi:hypothetical protein
MGALRPSLTCGRAVSYNPSALMIRVTLVKSVATLSRVFREKRALIIWASARSGGLTS